MTALFQLPARHMELPKLLMMYWEQSQFSKRKASLHGKRQGYTHSLWMPAKTNAGSTPVPALRDLKVPDCLIFPSVFDFWKRPLAPTSKTPALLGGTADRSCQHRHMKACISPDEMSPRNNDNMGSPSNA